MIVADGCVASRLMCRINAHGGMLPDIADRCDKGNVAAAAARILSDIVHLRIKLRHGVNGETLILLMQIVEVVLRVWNNRDRKAMLRRLLTAD